MLVPIGTLEKIIEYLDSGFCEGINMCKYCEREICESCTTNRGSTNCLHCEQHDEYTFKWNYCPMCGELYRTWENGHEYVRNHYLDLDKIRAYESKTAPHKVHILLIDENGNKEFTF